MPAQGSGMPKGNSGGIEGDAPAAPKRRGRPPKPRPAEPEAKRPRGRPRKVPIAATAEPAPKRRGRPPKVAAQEAPPAAVPTENKQPAYDFAIGQNLSGAPGDLLRVRATNFVWWQTAEIVQKPVPFPPRKKT